MVDPFTIIGLASSIIAFVDVSIKLVSQTKAIYDSCHGTTTETHEIEVILKDIRMKNAEFRHHTESNYRPLPYEKHILDMVAECERLGSELSDKLRKLKMRDGRRSKTVESSRVALQSWWKRKDIVALQDRLMALDGRIRMRVKEALDGDILSEIKALGNEHKKLNVNYCSKLDDLRNTIISLTEADDNIPERLESLKNDLIYLEKERKDRQREIEVIRSLHFHIIRRRWSEIKDAGQFTNDWLFDRSKTTFLDWLESGDGIYWISGKAGSGKSTLMKFASDSRNTFHALKKWSSPAQLHIASYYFWYQGFPKQKSQEGLLQSLLYQILKSVPDLIPKVCPDHLEYEDWHFQELKATFSRISNLGALPVKFCFFIDALDEYNGDEKDIVKMISFLCQSAYVKICVSSRPWRIFEDAFQESGRTLAVQDFTKGDMKRHAFQELQVERFRHLDDREKLCEEIITHISEKAQGVWLWASLVIRALVHAVEHDEGPSKLRSILEEFPPDLETYFQSIISRVKPTYREEMARIFLITIEEVQPLPLFAFSLLEKEMEDDRYAIKAQVSPVKTWDSDQVWKSRIHNRCLDLLVVGDGLHPTFHQHPVDFLHRTVRDFLQDCYYGELTKELKSPFNPLVSLCRMSLFLLKVLPNTELRNKEGLNKVFAVVDELLYYAHEAEKRVQSEEFSLVEVLDEVDRVNCHYARNASIKRHWTNARDTPAGSGWNQYHDYGNCNFLALAVQARLVTYVSTKLQPDSRRLQKAGRPLLDYALRPRRVTAFQMPYHSQRDEPSVDINMVRLLLEHGADPNQKVHVCHGLTVWALFLLSCSSQINRREGLSPSLGGAWYVACEMLIQYGAKPNCSFGFDDMTVHSTLCKIFGNDKAYKLLAEMQVIQAQRSRSSWLSGWWLPKMQWFDSTS
ncbi:hypothetical protein AWENTII_005169 [Aspergillus wentii]|nr:hypothetical protein MW887_008774 [Aspergillus wentii]